jgi:hypothetical protein
MRALTGTEQFKEEDDDQVESAGSLTKRQDFVERQRTRLQQCAGNCMGLSLQFRARMGGAGFAFHDRFLIFPYAAPKPLAWSLGTSVNTVGKEHHIVQIVSDGRPIADAFQKLWDTLDQAECLVWKTP